MKHKLLSSINFGLLGIIVIVNSGCATHRPIPAERELDSFVINCNIKREQVEFLQSLRSSKLERQLAALARPFTRQSGATPSAHTDSIINSHIRRIRAECHG